MTRVAVDCSLCRSENITSLEHIKENELVFCDSCTKSFNALQCDYRIVPYETVEGDLTEEPPPIPDKEEPEEIIGLEKFELEPITQDQYPIKQVISWDDWEDFATSWVDEDD